MEFFFLLAFLPLEGRRHVLIEFFSYVTFFLQILMIEEKKLIVSERFDVYVYNCWNTYFDRKDHVIASIYCL